MKDIKILSERYDKRIKGAEKRNIKKKHTHTHIHNPPPTHTLVTPLLCVDVCHVK